jgi:hypothetical protein
MSVFQGSMNTKKKEASFNDKKTQKDINRKKKILTNGNL